VNTPPEPITAYLAGSSRRYSSRIVRLAAASAGAPETAPGNRSSTSRGVDIPAGRAAGRFTEKPATNGAAVAVSRNTSSSRVPGNGATLRNTGPATRNSPIAVSRSRSRRGSWKKLCPSRVLGQLRFRHR
jgi:hypothetical protein